MYLIGKFVIELMRIGKGFGLLFLSKYIFYIFFSIRKVLQLKSLGIIDAKIRGNVRVKAFGCKLLLLDEMMPTIREVLLKNCYGFDSGKRYSTIVDLGANRGVFSVMASRFTDKVISVECNMAEFSDKCSAVMAMNDVSNACLITKYAASYTDESHISLNQIVHDFALTEIGFLKVDIEGAEGELFSANLEWLAITKEISMEVHPCFGVDTHKIIDTLRALGFTVCCYDMDMRHISDFTRVSMGYLRADR